jgi:hypothetical protein
MVSWNEFRRARVLESQTKSVDSISTEWAARLATIDTVLGRLSVLGSLRDLNTGRYVHHGMSISVGNSTHAILLKSHMEVFAHWHALSLREQMRDVKTFIETLRLPDSESGERMDRHAKRRLVLETWTELEPYRNFVPLAASKLERDLFLANINSIIAILRNTLKSPAHETAGES